LTAPQVIERIVSASLFHRPPEAGDYFYSPTGRSVIAVSRVRRMVGERSGIRFRLFGMRVRLGGVPAGITPQPWPRKPVKAPPLPTAEMFIGPPPPPTPAPDYRLKVATERFQARRRVVGLLRDDRDSDRLVAKVRMENQTAQAGEWRDPDDLSVVRRTARVVRGFRGRDSIEVLLDNGSISRGHARAARRFRKDYELGEIGLRAARNLADAPNGFASGTGPSESRMKHLEAYRATVSALMPHLLEVIVAIVIQDETTLSYSQRKRMNRQAVAGYLLASLDHLADHYAKLDNDRKAQLQRESREAQPAA
jgi:hypothetical protein